MLSMGQKSFFFLLPEKCCSDDFRHPVDKYLSECADFFSCNSIDALLTHENFVFFFLLFELSVIGIKLVQNMCVSIWSNQWFITTAVHYDRRIQHTIHNHHYFQLSCFSSELNVSYRIPIIFIVIISLSFRCLHHCQSGIHS